MFDAETTPHLDDDDVVRSKFCWLLKEGNVNDVDVDKMAERTIKNPTRDFEMGRGFISNYF
jgi:hypothetical protein